jgi:hypothetical protein
LYRDLFISETSKITTPIFLNSHTVVISYKIGDDLTIMITIEGPKDAKIPVYICAIYEDDLVSATGKFVRNVNKRIKGVRNTHYELS